MISDNGLAYSFKKYLEERLGIPSYIKYDGFELPKEKPFILIESMQNNNESISKLRETISTTFRYQISVYAETSYDKSEYQDRLRELFLFGVFSYFDSKGIETDKKFLVEPDFNEVPIMSGEITEVTKRHRVHFDVEIVANSHKNRGGK